MGTKTFQQILNEKRNHYGHTEAAIEFAAEEYARQGTVNDCKRPYDFNADIRQQAAENWERYCKRIGYVQIPDEKKETKLILGELHDELVFMRGMVPESSAVKEKQWFNKGLRGAFDICIDEVKKRIGGTNFNPNQSAYASEKGNAKFAGDMKMIDFFDPVP